MAFAVSLALALVGVATYLGTCFTLLYAALFLLYPPGDTSVGNTQSDVVYAFLVDLSLLAAFSLQHSVLASESVKNLFDRIGLKSMQRAVYVASTSAVMQALMRLWQPIGSWYLWKVESSSSVQYVLIALHLLAWFTMACSSLALDCPELLGMKQIYYSLRNLECPMDYKSPTVRRLYSHCRHPILIPLLVLVWAAPVMSVDRLVLATCVPLYLLARSGLDWDDASYVHEQYLRKQMKLHCH
ncbi:nurim homolog [Sycon ciliatum]|uniref:nurim homolog n=1 Tax=Sycon ciliatum TaxID=27933 RepID=UPI0020A95A93|eukprot:scpid79951/ scgid17516/ Nurim homolog; Nuclear envelope membrane protein; Nuclear rim protein